MGMILKVFPVLALSVWLLAGCTSAERDTRYLQSEQRPPLVIPSGLATPAYNEQMQVPRVSTSADEGVDLERPPTLVDTQ